MITIKRVSDISELHGIKTLQNENLRKNIGEDESMEEGFLTAEYSIEFLEKMHHAAPSIIAKHDDNVVGYALVSTRDTGMEHALLNDLFKNIDSKIYKGTPLNTVNYVVVGQLCVGKGYRGMGLVSKMYNHFRDELSDQYTYLITDVHDQNPRSVKAHLKSGFEIIDTLSYGGSNWFIVLWDWRT